MKLLLLMPDGKIHRLKAGPVCISFREAPLTLTMLAALVPSELDAHITIVDGSIDPIPMHADIDLVGISCLTGTALQAYRIADHFRARGIPVVLGGVHVSLLPDEAAAHADAIVTGFAETAWPTLLHDFSRGHMRSRYDGGYPSLGGLPHPRRDLQRRSGYAVPQTVMATRGCRGRCDFCTVPAVPFGWHTRPIGEVVDEIRTLSGRRIVFNDVSLAEDPLYARELFTAMIPLGIEWGGLVTTRAVRDDELLDLMARSGCRYLLLGFESLNDDALSHIHKGFNKTDNYRELMSRLHDRGISVQGCFIFGLDDDTRDVFDHTVTLVNELKVDIPRYAIYTPYPGTAAFERMASENRLLHRNWQLYDTRHAVFQPRHMSPAELETGFYRAWRETFRIPAIVRRLSETPRLPISLVGNLAYRRFAGQLPQEPCVRGHE